MKTEVENSKIQLPNDVLDLEENSKEKSNVKSNIPDGGWGWIVLFAAFIIRIIMAGVYSSFALFTDDFVREFKMSPSVMSWMIAIYSAVALLISPLATVLFSRFGHRAVSIAGLAIAGLTYPATYFYPTLWFTFLTASVIVALAQGLTNMCANVILTTYFDKRLSIAMGVYSCSSGVAAFALTPLMSVIIKSFGWKLSKVLYSTLYIFAILCAITFRPVNSTKKEKPKETKIVEPSDTAVKSEVMIEIDTKSDNLQGSNLYNFISMTNMASKFSINEKTLFASIQNFGLSQNVVNKNEINFTNIPISTLVGMSIASNLNLKNEINESSSKNIEVVVREDQPEKKNKKRGYFSLLKNPIFIIVLLSNLLSNLAYDTPTIFTKTKALELGISETNATLLLTLIGLGNIIGRLGFGFLGARKQMKPYLLTCFCLMISGLSILFSRIAFTFPLMVTYVLGFSIFIGGYVTLAPVLLVKILDIEDFSNGLSILFVAQAVGLFFGAPISGFIYDATKSFNWPFISCGSMIFTSGLVLAMSYFSKDFRKSQNE